MTFRDVCILVAAIGAIVLVTRCSRDPERTALPFGSTGLSGVQTQLKRLPAPDRARVEAYVKRSNGDVLTRSMADPDLPLTARTFGEAIALQRAHSTPEVGRVLRARGLRFSPSQREREAPGCGDGANRNRLRNQTRPLARRVCRANPHLVRAHRTALPQVRAARFDAAATSSPGL